MDFQKAIQDKVAEQFATGKVDELIEEAAAKAIKEGIDDAFRSFGSAGKAIRDGIQNSLRIDLDRFDIDSYNNTIVNMVKKVALEHLEDRAQEVIERRLSELLSPAPEKITIQEIVDEFRESWKEMGDFSVEPKIQIEHHAWSTSSTTIKLFRDYDPKSRYGNNSPDLDIFISEKRILLPRLNTSIFATKQQFDNEARIYQMAVSQTEITDAHTADEYDIEVSLITYD